MSDTDVVKFATGTLVEMESLREALADAGVTANIVGDELTAGLGSTLPGTIELWVREADVAKAKAAAKEYQKSAGK
jgi:Putative prokaryotic signal transducing protein